MKNACFECATKERIMYRCRYGGKKDWVYLCQNCLLTLRSEHRDHFEFDETWKTF